MSFKRLFGTRKFLLYWVAQIISRIGDSVHEIALLWLVYDVTGNPALLGAVVVAELLPNIAITLPAGSIVDRWSKKRLMVITETLRAGNVLLIPVVGQSHPGLIVPVVIGVASFDGLMEGVFEPAREAILPELVEEEQLDSANVLSNLTARIAQLFYIIGGVIIAVQGSFYAFYLNAASFVVAAVVYLQIPMGDAVDEGRGESFSIEETISDIRNGLSYVSASRLLLTFIVIESLLGGIVSALSVVLPVYADRVLGGGSQLFGALLGTFAVGLLFGTLSVRALESNIKAHRGQAITVCTTVCGLMMLGISLAPTLLGAPIVGSVVPLFAFGLFLGVVTIAGNTLLYMIIPEDKRGMVFSVMLTIGQSAGPIFIVVISASLNVVDPGTIFLALGTLVTAGGLWTLLTPLWQFTDAETEKFKQVDGSVNEGA